MIKILPLLILFFSCTAKEAKITEDLIEGEVKTAEQILEDVSGVPSVK